MGRTSRRCRRLSVFALPQVWFGSQYIFFSLQLGRNLSPNLIKACLNGNYFSLFQIFDARIKWFPEKLWNLLPVVFCYRSSSSDCTTVWEALGVCCLFRHPPDCLEIENLMQLYGPSWKWLISKCFRGEWKRSEGWQALDLNLVSREGWAASRHCTRTTGRRWS